MNQQKNAADIENLVAHLQSIAHSLPQQTAIVDGQLEYTYDMLNGQANQLAAYLINSGIRPQSRVAICLRQSYYRVVAFLAVLKTGAAYLPIDGLLPSNRIRTMIEDANADLVLTEQYYKSTFSALTTLTTLVDEPSVQTTLAGLSTENIQVDLRQDSCAYIIYTSGSSGKPKGVMISHRSLYHFVVQQAGALGIERSHRTLQFASPGFDASVIDIWVPLSCGATVVLYPDNRIVGGPLLDFIVARNIDAVPILPPAVLASLPTNKPIGKLSLIAIGGEAGTEQTIRNWYKKVKLINSYGPTEATVAVSNYHFTEDPAPRTIGTALPGNGLWVLDEQLQQVPEGMAGELYISGPQLSLGYINRPDETEKAFIPVPAWLAVTSGRYDRLYKTGDRVVIQENGTLTYLGREDEQVKIRGYRIELAEIEHAIARLPQVAQAAIKVDRPEQGLPSLVAFIQPASGTGANNVTAIRARLQQSIPSYMIPDKIVFQDMLPLNHAGKVDKAQLQLPSRAAHQAATKRKDTDLAQYLLQVWKDLLGLDDISTDADFFDLGGNSLLLAMLHAQLPEAVQARISVPELYTYTTISSLVREAGKRLSEAELSQKAKAAQTIRELQKDATLQFDLTPGAMPDPALLRSPRHIFLTGATGFVGAHLLEELLLQHPQATIHCLVRAVDASAALERIRATFHKFRLSWLPAYETCVLPVAGDLSVPQFGLDNNAYRELSNLIDVIYHSGSSVSYVQPYQVIKKPNIDGLHGILHLAATTRVKFLVLLSSMGVFSWGRPFTGKTWMYEDDPIDQNLEAVSRDLGYIKSKWVMEAIIAKAKARGLPVINCRLGFAVCHSKSGATVHNQWWGALIRSCVQLQSFPLIMGLKDELTTVDYMCKAIAHIGKQAEAVGQNFHLSPLPENDVSLTDFCAKINEYFGLHLQGMDYHQWLDQWRYNTETPLYPLLGLFTEDVHEGKSLVEAYENTYYYDRSNTARFLAGTGLKPPAFTYEVMLPYLRFMGVIP